MPKYNKSRKGITTSNINSRETFLSYAFEVADKETQPDVKKLLLGSLLLDMVMNNSSFHTAPLDYLKKYNEMYPDNPLTANFNHHIKLLNDYSSKLQEADTTRIKVIENRDSLTTLASVLEQFKGKPLLIDFWFSSCKPCLREMKETAELKKWLKANDVDMLYVSIDGDAQATKWMETIKYNKIYGHHLQIGRAHV